MKLFIKNLLPVFILSLLPYLGQAQASCGVIPPGECQILIENQCDCRICFDIATLAPCPTVGSSNCCVCPGVGGTVDCPEDVKTMDVPCGCDLEVTLPGSVTLRNMPGNQTTFVNDCSGPNSAGPAYITITELGFHQAI